MAVKAFYQLLELQGIKLGFEDSSVLEKQCRDKPGSQNVRYKEALQMIQPEIKKAMTMKKKNNGNNMMEAVMKKGPAAY